MTFTLKQKQNFLIYLKAKEGKVLHLEVDFSRLFDKSPCGRGGPCGVCKQRSKHAEDSLHPTLSQGATAVSGAAFQAVDLGSSPGQQGRF